MVRRLLSLMLIVGASFMLAGVSYAASCAGVPAWSANTAYNGGAQVQYDGSLYTANWWSKGADPASHSGQYQEWTLNGACDGGGSSSGGSSSGGSSSGGSSSGGSSSGGSGTVIQAEDYSTFFDTTAGNSGGAYRSDDVDIEATSDAGGGYDVGWTAATEWLAFNNISFPTSGSYTIQVRVASANSGESLSLDLNAGSIVLGTVNVPNTGGWQNWQTVSINVSVNAGTYDLGLYAITGGWNINWIKVIPNGGGSIATVYADCPFSGWSVSLGEGSYTLGQLQALGFVNDKASSIQVAAGYEAVLYWDDNFQGASVTVSGDDSCLTDEGFNDQVSSIVIQPAGGGSSSGGSSSGGSSGGSSSGGSSSGGSSGGTIPGFVLSPYKDVGINAHWADGGFQMSVKVTGAYQNLVQALNSTSGMNAVTFAFATGSCTNPSWAGYDVSFVSGAAQALDAAGDYYIVSTGGAAGSFSCSSGSGLVNFIGAYYTSHMAGVDFDIEHTPSDVNGLVASAKAAQQQYPGLRISFTLATLGSNSGGSQLNSTGQAVMAAIQAEGMTGEYINLMTMDYGGASSYVCVVVGGQCDMGKSAVAAAKSMHNVYGIPYDHIEITPMIGQNDTNSNVFTLQDADEVSAFAQQYGIGGIHFWSFDRDVGCGGSLTVCNHTGQPAYAFSNRFASDLGL